MQLNLSTWPPWVQSKVAIVQRWPLLGSRGVKCNITFVKNVLPREVTIVERWSSGNILNTRDSGSSGYPNPEKIVENTRHSRKLLTKILGVWIDDETVS